MSAIVCGGGLGGIAAALRLRAKGHEVTLIERGERLGGRARTFERDGFKHDAGPTVVTAPFLFEELFELFGERFEDHVQLVPLTPWYRFQYPDGTHFDYGGSVEDTKAEIARIEPRDVEGYERLLEHSKRIFDVGFTELSDEPFHQFGTMVKQVPKLMELRSHLTVWQFVSKYLSHPKLQWAFSIQPLLVGGNPFDTTSIYSLIHHVEREWGIHFAMGGTGSIVQALEDLMRRHGVRIEMGQTVERVLIEKSVAKGVVLEGGEERRADVTVSNADAAYLHGEMVPRADRSLASKAKLASAHYSMGLFVLYFGTTQQYPDVAHHTVWFGKRYKELLNDIFNKKVLAEDFSLYVHRPTATDPSFAPEGCDSFYVLCPVPNLQGDVDWAVEGPRLRDRIVKALDETMLPGLQETITADFYMTPEDFKTDYLSVHGAGFSVAPLFRQSAWFRFHNRAEGIKNLYLVGAGTHPGAGMPGVLCSAKVVDKLVPAEPVG
ncbi:MAG: phytoene desaturase family protein [Planctomycetota bacterium]|nr:phytoene desaturase family protein [Planctomycetota bacterium]